MTYKPSNAGEMLKLHDRLGSMIDQVGQPDYSLREMVNGLREVRDALFALSRTTWPREVQTLIEDFDNPCFGGAIHNDIPRTIGLVVLRLAKEKP